MDDITYVGSRAVSKRKATDHVDIRPSKRILPKKESSSDEETDTAEVGAAMSAVRISTEPQITHPPTSDKQDDRAMHLYSDRAERNKATHSARSRDRQTMQKYIRALEHVVRRNTRQGQPDRRVLDEGIAIEKEWATQINSPYGLWAASREALLKHIAELEGHRRPEDLAYPVEASEKIAILESRLANKTSLIGTMTTGFRGDITRLKDELLRLDREKATQVEENRTLKTQIVELTKQRVPAEADLPKTQALQTAIAERDQARVNAEKLRRQLRDLQKTQDEMKHKNESEGLRQRLQEEKVSAKVALKTSKSENKELRRVQKDLQAQIEERNAEIDELKSNRPCRDSKKDRSGIKDARKQAESARQSIRKMYNHYDTLHSKNMILIGKYEMLGRLLNVGAPGSSFRKELDGLKAPALNDLEEYEYEE